jgi:hypothetical protein
VRDNQALGNITYLDGVASVRNYVRGAFASLSGPWVKGVNMLVIQKGQTLLYKTNTDTKKAHRPCNFFLTGAFGETEAFLSTYENQ